MSDLLGKSEGRKKKAFSFYCLMPAYYEHVIYSGAFYQLLMYVMCEFAMRKYSKVYYKNTCLVFRSVMDTYKHFYLMYGAL